MANFEIFNADSEQPAFDLTNYKFFSNYHMRYVNGVVDPLESSDRWICVKVERNESADEYYTVTIYNLESNNPVWGNHTQLAQTKMKLIERTSSKIQLIENESSFFGHTFSNYGLTILLEKNLVSKVVFHRYKNNIEVVYFNASDDISLMKAFDKKDAYSSPGLAEILSYSEKIQKCSNLSTLRNLFNENRTFNHPMFFFDFGIAFLQRDDKENAKKALIQGALYGVSYPCDYYNTPFIDSVGQCISTLLTSFPINDKIKLIKLSALAFIYLSKCIELNPNLSYDSYKSRGYMMLSLNVDYAIDHFFIPNMPLPGIQILSSMSDLFYAATIDESPHKNWLIKSLEMFELLKNYNVSYQGQNVNTYTIEEICEYGYQINQQLFKKIEIDYMNGAFDMTQQDIFSV